MRRPEVRLRVVKTTKVANLKSTLKVKGSLFYVLKII